jgi:microcystin-dependent protein
VSTLSITRSVVNGTTFTASQNDTQCTNVESWANGNIDSTNIAAGGITQACMASSSIGASQLIASSVGVSHAAADLLAALIPTGAVLPYVKSTAPTGWLTCDGSAVSRTSYAALFNIIGTTHGVGNGTTTFNVPDYRGRFMRGWDNGAGRDPDAATRTHMQTGVVVGDVVGSVQTGAYASHNHTATDSGHTHTAAGTGANPGGPANTGGGTYASSTTVTTSSGTANITVGNSGGSETRPLNANVHYIIKT